MNKLLKKLATTLLGFSLAVGGAIAISAGCKDASPVHASLSGDIGDQVTSSNFATGSAILGVQIDSAMNYITGIDSNWIRVGTNSSSWVELTISGQSDSFTLSNGSGQTIYMSANNRAAFSSNNSTSFSIDDNGLIWYSSTQFLEYNSSGGIRAYAASASRPDAGLYFITSSQTTWELASGGTLEVTTDPYNLTYYSNDTNDDIDVTGAVVKATYWDADAHGTTKQETIDNDNLNWSLDLANEHLNVSYTEGSVTQTASIDIVVDSGSRPKVATFTFTSSNVAGGDLYNAAGTAVIGSIATSRGSGSSNPAWNSSDSAVRIYAKNTITITLTDYALVSVVFTLKSGSSFLANPSVSEGTLSGTTISFESTDMFKSVTFQNSTTATSGNTKFLSIQVTYKNYVQRVPAKLTASLISGDGNFYNGSTNASKLFSTNITVSTFTSDDLPCETYAAGTGFIIEVASKTYDASSTSGSVSFENVSPNTYSVKITVPGVGASGADVVNNSAFSITINAKAPQTYEWTAAQTTVFYAHRDTFAVDGTLKLTFNDGSNTSSASNFSHTIREYDENATNHAGSEVTLPTHQDGTLNVNSQTIYVLDSWHKDYSSGLHNYVEFTVKVPTLTVTDNYSGSYYVGAERNLDVTVTATFESQNSRNLDSSEYTLSQSSVTPLNTNPIQITASWTIDGVSVKTASFTINPEVSTRELNELIVSDQTLPAGSNFVLTSGSIVLDVTEAGEDDLEELEQSAVTIKKGNQVYTSTDRIKKSDTGTFTVTYSEGVDNTVEATFTLTVTNAVVETISSTTSIVYNKITTADDLASGAKYLVVCEGKNVALNGASDTLSGNNDTPVEIANSQIIGTNTLNSAVVTITSKSGGYSMKTESGTYLGHASGAGNTLSTSSDDTFTLTITFEESGDATVSCDGRVFRRNNSSNQFRYYTSGQTEIQLYKQTTETIYTGNKVSYLKSVIDAYRLNSGTEGNVCNAQSSIYSSSDWTTAKTVYASLISSEITELSVQDYFGESGKTYVDTYEMLLEKEPSSQNAGSMLVNIFGENSNTIAIIVIISMVSVTAIGGYFFLRKRKEQ